jgi:hypothetical protein
MILFSVFPKAGMTIMLGTRDRSLSPRRRRTE